MFNMLFKQAPVSLNSNGLVAVYIKLNNSTVLESSTARRENFLQISPIILLFNDCQSKKILK